MKNLFFAAAFGLAAAAAVAAEPPLRVGVIGLDAHAVPWAKILAAAKPDGPHPELTGLQIVAAVPAGPGREPRVTLTFPVLLAARRRLVLAAGAGKREAVEAALRGPEDGVPAARLRAATGPTTWIVDRAAAG